MTPRDVRAFLLDVLERTAETRAFVGTSTREEFIGSRLLQAAIERELSVIGEAVIQVIRLRPDLEPRISSAPKIVGLRNRLVHAYMSVDPHTLFDIVEFHLGPLQREVEQLRRELGG